MKIRRFTTLFTIFTTCMTISYATIQTNLYASTPAPITNTWILNSGADNSGALLPAGSADLHWTAYLADDYNNLTYYGPGYVLSPTSQGAWAQDNKSQWISLSDSAYPNPYSNCKVVYRATFDLTGYNIDTVRITGLYSADDLGNEVTLNGRVVNNLDTSWYYTTPLNIKSGFVQGVNTLDFVNYQTDNFYDGIMINAKVIATTGATPAPTITSFAPSYVPAGRSGITLSIHGTTFLYGCVVNWNGTPLKTIYYYNTLVKAEVPTTLLMHDGEAFITITNPDGSTSSPATYSVIGEQPVVSTFAPVSVPAGRKAFVLSIHGEHFTSGCYATWNGTPLTTTYYYDTLIKVNVPASLVAAAGSPEIIVHNPGDDGGDSDPAAYIVTP